MENRKNKKKYAVLNQVEDNDECKNVSLRMKSANKGNIFLWRTGTCYQK